MFPILVAAFVLAACLATIVFVTVGLIGIRRDRAYLDQQIEEDIQAGVFDVVGRRMDVPGKYPVLRTRNTKVLSGK